MNFVFHPRSDDGWEVGAVTEITLPLHLKSLNGGEFNTHSQYRPYLARFHEWAIQEHHKTSSCD
jgi:hypothetical protein